MSYRVASARDEPRLAELASEQIDGGFYEYNHHGQVVESLWPQLLERFPSSQLVLWDDTDGTVLGIGNSIPCRWDGTVEGLPGGIDEVFELGVSTTIANTLSALLIKIATGRQGEGLSRLILEAMRERARSGGFQHLIAPVRPNWKERYPITPIEEYMSWKRPDGLPFDPWIRVHHRLGAELLAAAPESMRIEGTVGEWEAWTEMKFPASGTYTFPGCLAPLAVNRAADRGVYFEPNVWMGHRTSA